MTRRGPEKEIGFDTFEPDTDVWIPAPSIDDIPGRRRTWTGKVGTDWEGCEMTLELIPERKRRPPAEPRPGRVSVARVDAFNIARNVRPEGEL